MIVLNEQEADIVWSLLGHLSDVEADPSVARRLTDKLMAPTWWRRWFP